MTAPAVERLSQIVKGDVMWEYARTDIPGRCDRFGWCDGGCEPLEPGRLGDYHSRYIASSLRGTELVEIGVGQWKADPAQPWYLSASAGCYDNKDRAPQVGIFTYPEDLTDTKQVFLKVLDAEVVASALRLVGADPFADALAAAVKFARKLGEEKQR